MKRITLVLDSKEIDVLLEALDIRAGEAIFGVEDVAYSELAMRIRLAVETQNP